MRETLSFEEVKQWFRASVGDSVSVQITSGSETVAFLDGRIDSTMGFVATESHGLLIEGAAGGWTLQLAEPDFQSATLSPIPDSFTLKQLTIKMRNHWVAIAPGIDPRTQRRPEE